MDNYITPALGALGQGATAVGHGLQTAAPYAENIAGLLAGIPLAAYQIDRSGPFNYLAGRQALLSDPQFQSMAGPFTTGLLEAFHLPSPNPEKVFQQQQAQAASQEFPQLSPDQQRQVLFGIHPQPPIPEGWVPTRMNTSTGGVTYQAPSVMPGGELKPATSGGQRIPGLFQTPRGGIVRDPSFRAAGGGGDVNTEFKLWRKDHPSGTFEDYQAAKASAAAGKQTAVDAAKQQALTNTTKTMVEAAPKVLHLADRVEQDLSKISAGPFASRYQEFMSGRIGAPNPEFTAYRTNVDLLQTLLMRMHVGARGSEGMLAHFANMINAGTQSPENMRAALQQIRLYAEDVEAAGKPKGVTLPGGKPTAAEPKPVEGSGTTSGGNEFSVDR